ncbi:MAG: hypothetical protein ABIP49_05790 [Lysobacterales bacterium]
MKRLLEAPAHASSALLAIGRLSPLSLGVAGVAGYLWLRFAVRGLEA